MLSPSNLLSLAFLYICALFAVAWYADRNAEIEGRGRSPVWRGTVYALSLGVYCSSWTFYGAVGIATGSPWSHAPIYLGPILVFVFGWPVIRRLLAVGSRHRVTSIADYIGARYGKRQPLAVLVTLVATAAVLPYISLQFKALAQTWSIVGGTVSGVEAVGGDTALLTAIVLSVFTILFGARRLDGRERHRGVMTAIAVESVVKLLAFVAVAWLALDYLAGIPVASPQERVSHAPGQVSISADFVARTLISALAILCLPRQFHAMVVEAESGIDTRVARWLFPFYLALFMLLVVPISIAGARVFSVIGKVNPDTYVQLLPIALESTWVTVAAFIGGISAATGMVIVATVSLAIMITNEVVAPFIMRWNADSPEKVLKLGDRLRQVRRFTIAGILFSAWLVTRQLVGIPWLAQIGFISFLAAAQLAPALLAGLYWRRAHGVGVIVGLLAGLALWFYCGLLPAVLPADSALLVRGPFAIDWLRPMNLFGIGGQSRLAYATAWSLSVNAFALIALSLALRPSRADVRQAKLFLDERRGPARARDGEFQLSLIRVSQLQALLPPFMEQADLQRMWREFEDSYQQRLLPADRAPLFVVQRVESVLARIIGATSAHKAMEQLERSQQLAYQDLAGMVSDASKLNAFNRELLQTTVESLVQGVAVVDAELRLVAWNTRYERIFDYPERFLYVGCPIERVYRFNAERGILDTHGGSVDDEVEKRLRWLRKGSPHRLERTLPNGSVIDILGSPMPHGGFVTTYIDITDYREVVAQLEEAKLELEQRVASGSQTLSEINARLRQENRLRAQVEAQLREAHQSKSRIMSATSHDLLQPIHAARLFASALKPQLSGDTTPEVRRIVDQIDGSLMRAEKLISELREMARLDSGPQQTRPGHFALGPLLDTISREFQPVAAERGLRLRHVDSGLWLYSDQSLVHRILQNLVGNAIKYTREGGVLVGARRRPGGIELQVWDSGPGIAHSDQMRIFQEFERLQRGQDVGEEGLGLGLSIVQRYASLMEHPLKLVSEQGRGSMFSVTVPQGQPQQDSGRAMLPSGDDLAGIRILCLDNEPLILDGMEQLLRTLGAEVGTARDESSLHQAFAHGARWDLILADYHLDDHQTGIDAVQRLQRDHRSATPCIVISADDSDGVRERAKAAGFRFLAKPVSAPRLRALALALTR
jgi:Na+/proline symporter/signal transduction histidine kinase